MPSIVRKFRLLEQLQKAQKGQIDGMTSYGLTQTDDITMTYWNASIVGPYDSVFHNRFYSLKIYCGPNYPQEAPLVQFIDRIIIPSVNQSSGKVQNLNLLKNWKPQYTLENLLVALKHEMEVNKSIKQPPAGTCY